MNMKNTKRKLQLLLLTLPTLLASALLIGCGDSSSNPLEKYDDIKGGPVTSEKAVVQTALRPDLFALNVVGTNQMSFVNFVEGEESTVLLVIKPKSPHITEYTVELTDFSNLSGPTLVATEKLGTYALKWLPPVGTIAGGNPSKPFQAQITATTTDSTDQLLGNVSNVFTLQVNVNRTSALPTITGYQLAKVVDEGVETEFSVDVMDPSSAVNPRMPELSITQYVSANTEAYRADGHKYFDLDEDKTKHPENPERKGNMYRFYYTLFIDRLPLDRDRKGREIPAATSVDMCFMMRALSGANTFSSQQEVCTKARYAAQPPAILFREIPELRAGHPVEITFQISSPHALSTVALSKPLVAIANLTGTKEITCTNEQPDKKNSQICVIKYTPACLNKVMTTSLLLKADSTLADKTKSTSMTKELTVLPDLQTCPVPVLNKKGAK